MAGYMTGTFENALEAPVKKCEHDLIEDECFPCLRARVAELGRERDDLSALVRGLIVGIRKFSLEGRLAEKAFDDLKRHNLQGSPLR